MSGSLEYYTGISGDIFDFFFHIQEEPMDKDEIRIVELPPMRVVCINGFGTEPEDQAFKKMYEWAKEHALLDTPSRLFGYDSPVQAPGSPNRGYDVWMTVDGIVQAD